MGKDKIEKEIESNGNKTFVEAIGNVDWSTTEDLVKKLDMIPDFWAQALRLEQAQEEWKRRFVRRKIKQIRVNGIPLFASVETTNEEGETIRVYKREDIFKPEDFQKAASYHGNVTVYNAKMAVHYAEGFENLTGKKMLLPFNPDCLVD